MSASACDSDGVEGIHGKQGVQGVGPLRRNRDFQLLWGGQAVSLLGSQTSKIAYPLLVLAMTGSPAKAGIAGFVAQRAALPMLVHPSQRSVAVGQNEARQNAAQLAGPALGGALFGLSRAAPFAADAVSYLASLVTLPFIKAPMQAGPLVSHAGSGGFRAGSRRFRASVGRLRAELGEGLGEGLAWTWRQPFLRYSAFFAASVNVLLQVLTLGLIVLARHDGAAPAEVGVIVACMGAGGLAGAFAAPWFQQRVPVGIAITGCMWIWTVLLALIVVIRVPLWLCPVVTMFGFVGAVVERIGPDVPDADNAQPSPRPDQQRSPANRLGSDPAGLAAGRFPAAGTVAVRRHDRGRRGDGGHRGDRHRPGADPSGGPPRPSPAVPGSGPGRPRRHVSSAELSGEGR